ncbi:SH3 domain-containing protein [Streptomyces sp. GS7]|uniref:SH3 domain-containing protein n=1 Tax=Streptomyces sp. GS7 TaxID=2692234 RepID=UPI001315CB3D|nr:SH3 domain-containing protein [Streptomyces sp. GS7]QHC22952.1 SH3 domain-containing protein [Streptomyces sp. GS7]
MRKYVIGTVVAGLAVIPLMTATSASAQATSLVAVSRAPAVAAPVSTCQVRATETLNIREEPTTSSDALGVLPKGELATCYGRTVTGGTYTACGPYSDKYWMPISYNGMDGYVPRTCVKQP